MDFHLIERLTLTFTAPLLEVLNRPSLAWALLAALAALHVVLNLTAIAFWTAAKRGLRHAWPMLVATLAYGILFVKVPPAVVSNFVSREADTAWNAIRVLLLGVSLILTYRELMRGNRENDRLEREVIELRELAGIAGQVAR